jgi:phosphoribosylaminoimidazole-succinocarboxamide synthase
MPALLHTAIPDLSPPRIGKVREVYDLGEELLIVATDRVSAFDSVMANGIPDKGRILTRLSAFWFDKLNSVCPNHLISVDDEEILGRLDHPQPELRGRSTLAKKARPLKIECVARGYISGSLYKEYLSHGEAIHDLNLQAGLVDSAQLLQPIFTPATKAESGHDENISFRRAVDIVGREAAELAREWTLKLFREASAHCAKKGLILADTKFEFGETDDGLIWIDEALTPDSSRFWLAESYVPGKSQPSFDKQFLRDYLESTDWDKLPPGPTLPEEIVQKTRSKYVEAYERISGIAFA